jgi:hypothetical protein
MFFMVNWVIFTENIVGHLKDKDSGLGAKKLRLCVYLLQFIGGSGSELKNQLRTSIVKFVFT